MFDRMATFQHHLLLLLNRSVRAIVSIAQLLDGKVWSSLFRSTVDFVAHFGDVGLMLLAVFIGTINAIKLWRGVSSGNRFWIEVTCVGIMG